MEDRIIDLEMRFMQQEKIIQELSDMVYRQEQHIVQIERELAMFRDQLRAISPSAICDQDDEAPPPHY